jgi:hypothetical protein
MRVRTESRLLALVLLSACSGIGDNFKEPDIQLDHAVVRGVGLTGGNIAIPGVGPS